MKIYDMTLPASLVSDVSEGSLKFSVEVTNRLTAQCDRLTYWSPSLYSLGNLEFENSNCRDKEIAEVYQGALHAAYSPGRVDFSCCVIIGETDADFPIVLDYRAPEPTVACSVLGSDGELYWVTVADSYCEFRRDILGLA